MSVRAITREEDAYTYVGGKEAYCMSQNSWQGNFLNIQFQALKSIRMSSSPQNSYE